jgi:hypothetical protein
MGYCGVLKYDVPHTLSSRPEHRNSLRIARRTYSSTSDPGNSKFLREVAGILLDQYHAGDAGTVPLAHHATPGMALSFCFAVVFAALQTRLLADNYPALMSGLPIPTIDQWESMQHQVCARNTAPAKAISALCPPEN